jgi:hypothetical protein
MALTLGQFVSGAGYVSEGMRQAEEAERLARQNQLQIEAQNRMAAEQARLREQRQAGLQVPNVPDFGAGAGGQQFTAPGLQTQPQQPAAQAFPVNMNVPQAQPLTPVAPTRPELTPTEPTAAPDTSTVAGRYQVSSQFDPATPLGRKGQQLEQDVQARQERDALITRLNYKYGPSTGLGGLFVAQTDEQRKQAQEVMDRLGDLTTDELRQLEATGQLPPPKPKKTGVKEPTTQPTATAATQPTKRGTQYDTTTTPYDELIAQSARQYGVDPIILKRLIGTESSFRPDVISKDGRDYGIAQINQVHLDSGRVTREQALDPNFAIPFAAELLASNLRNANGDYTAALLMYKGAKTDQGIASVTGAINDILLGTGAPGEATAQLLGKNPGQTADRVAQATSAAPAQAGIMYGPSAVAGGMQNPAIQSALMARQILVERADMFYRLGMDDQALESVAQIGGIDLGLYKAQADLGIQDLSISGDAGRAMSVYSQFTGTPTQALARGDGTFDIYRNGNLAQTAVPVDKLADLVKTAVNDAYRQQKAELTAELAKERAQTVREIGKEQVRGGYALAEKAMELQQQQRINLGNGQALIAEPDGRLFIVDASRIEQTESPQGVMMPPTVQRVRVQ